MVARKHAKRANSDVLLRVRGTVQGVGFRPFVQRVATRLGLRGWVRNDAEGVLIRAVGPASVVTALERALTREAPGAARVERVEVSPTTAPDDGEASPFEIVASGPGGMGASAAITPDLALCPQCRRELLDPRDRRHLYPFINCTQCGPRYSIIERLPYDRPATTMRAFRMCPQCAAEYADQGSRRFHAQPNACPVCGPRASLRGASGEPVDAADPVAGAARLLGEGRILAVKGIGGYHLMVDARNEAAVAELRRRKHRDEKPLAVMFPDLSALRAAAEVAEADALLLASRADRPPEAPPPGGARPGHRPGQPLGRGLPSVRAPARASPLGLRARRGRDERQPGGGAALHRGERGPP
jgi:hydrogenase maturation protein HypF